jgi:hypothetical protein
MFFTTSRSVNTIARRQEANRDVMYYSQKIMHLSKTKCSTTHTDSESVAEAILGVSDPFGNHLRISKIFDI